MRHTPMAELFPDTKNKTLALEYAHTFAAGMRAYHDHDVPAVTRAHIEEYAAICNADPKRYLALYTLALCDTRHVAQCVASTYLKHYFGEPMASGIALCRSGSTKRDTLFYNCTFHATCDAILFVNCVFVQCDHKGGSLPRRDECLWIG